MANVLVSGYFDGLHSGHIRFLETAREVAGARGRVIVCLGCDGRLRSIKHREPICEQHERLYMVQACRHVDKAFVSPHVHGEGGVVWEEYLVSEQIDTLLVNDDLNLSWQQVQQQACERHGVRYLVREREPALDLPPQASTEQSRRDRLPYRVVLSTGMDQMQLSRIRPGACVGFSIEPTHRFEDRCGMATSTRKAVRAIWGNHLPAGDPVDQAKAVFACDNAPLFPVDPCEKFPWGTYAPRYITGSVDAISVVIPGATYMLYDGGPWPSQLDTISDPETLDWLEEVVTLLPTRPRPPGDSYELRPTEDRTRLLAEATDRVWAAVQQRHTAALAAAVNDCTRAFGELCPTYLANGIQHVLDARRGEIAGMFPQGAGCGGYIVCINDHPGDRIRIRVRRPQFSQ